jgi:hypothetical protein
MVLRWVLLGPWYCVLPRFLYAPCVSFDMTRLAEKIGLYAIYNTATKKFVSHCFNAKTNRIRYEDNRFGPALKWPTSRAARLTITHITDKRTKAYSDYVKCTTLEVVLVASRVIMFDKVIVKPKLKIGVKSRGNK